MMYGDWGYGMGFGFGWIFMIIFWGLIIWGIITIIRGFGHDGCCNKHQDHESQKEVQGRKNTAMDILDERYAKGEIDKGEYETKKKDLNQ